MKITKNSFILLVITVLLSGCALYKNQYRNPEDAKLKTPNKEIDRTFYLIGDAGKSPTGELSKALKAFQKDINTYSSEKDYAIFLGDNIYPAGLPKEDDETRKTAEYYLNAQLKSVENFKGKTIFIPGNHDWYAGGVIGVKREEDYIKKALGEDSYIPENGCPLESIDISEKIQLIIIDSQWYLENWNNNPTINDNCEIKTRERFLLELEGELKKAQHKKVIFAMHHPMFTNGIHGGYYGAKKHIFPTQKNIPLPILSSLLTQVRTLGGVSIQDRYNERYNKLMKRLEALASNYDNIVFVSGHEHTLQYIEDDRIKQIVSGAGAKESGAALSNNGLFASGMQGFAKLIIYKDGSSWVQVFTAEDGEPVSAYAKEVHPKDRDLFKTDTLPTSFPNRIDVSIYSKEETDKSDFYEVLFGNRYRNFYSTKINVKVATLDTLYGGLEIVRPGGGHQTRSLRLRKKDGRELNMRALRKSATQYLQTVLFKNTYVEDEFEQTAIEDLILDFYTAAHPYAFLVMPELSDAASLFHTNPKLYFIPKHEHLGDYNTDYGGELYMIEERPEENYADKINFGYSDDLESTHDVLEKIREDEKYKIDENSYIRARLFDMLVGDWDRHQDQWRWAQFDQENGDKWFRPIPRDRDQVFSNFDGALLDLMRTLSGSANQLQTYDGELKDVKWINKAGVKLDKTLLQRLNKDAWVKQAEYLQENITDAVIKSAFSKIPEAVRDSSLIEIQNNLKSRRKNLRDIAERYFDYLNELVILTGTDSDDFIEITRVSNRKTAVKISRIIDGEKGEVILDRVFDKKITQEIWIYGLDDKDIFEVSGKADNPIYIRIIGGQENDTYRIKNGRRVRIYDHRSKENNVEINNGAKLDFTDTYSDNLFDYNKTIEKGGGINPTLGYNPDDGTILGLENVSIVKGFHRNPFSIRNSFEALIYTATKGFEFNYSGEFANLFGDWNLKVTGKATNDNYAVNFFGYGNNTKNEDESLGRDYNRIRLSAFGTTIGLKKRGSFGSDYGINFGIEAIKTQSNENRFIETFRPADINEGFYDRRFIAGAQAEFNYESFDNKLLPTRGMLFNVNTGLKTQIGNTSLTHVYLNSELHFYTALSTNRKLVLKTNANAQIRFTDNLLFFQAAQIGARNGLRGFRAERFTGQNSFVGGADVRYSFDSFKTKFLPLQLGVFAGSDVGRVWLSNEDVNNWHYDYGVGFWVTAANSIKGNFNFFNSKEGFRFSFGFGYNF
jgi:hypothetical protein